MWHQDQWIQDQLLALSHHWLPSATLRLDISCLSNNLLQVLQVNDRKLPMKILQFRQHCRNGGNDHLLLQTALYLWGDARNELMIPGFSSQPDLPRLLCIPAPKSCTWSPWYISNQVCVTRCASDLHQCPGHSPLSLLNYPQWARVLLSAATPFCLFYKTGYFLSSPAAKYQHLLIRSFPSATKQEAKLKGSHLKNQRKG